MFSFSTVSFLLLVSLGSSRAQVISLFLPFYSASYSQEKDDEGICLTGADVALACTAGTPLGEKLVLALTACSDSDTEEALEMRKRKKGKGKGKKGRCPSVENIVEKIGTEMEGN